MLGDVSITILCFVVRRRKPSRQNRICWPMAYWMIFDVIATYNPFWFPTSSVEVNDAQHIPFVDQVGLLKTFFSSLDSIWIPIVTGQQPTLSICFRSRMDANPWCLYAITKMSGVGVCKHACFFRSFVIECSTMKYSNWISSMIMCMLLFIEIHKYFRHAHSNLGASNIFTVTEVILW